MTKNSKLLSTAIILSILLISSYMLSASALPQLSLYDEPPTTASSTTPCNTTVVPPTLQIPKLQRESSEVIPTNKSLLHVVWPGFDDQPQPPRNYPRDNSTKGSGESIDYIPPHPAWGTQIWQQPTLE
jgi:hypothetical protein